MIPLRPISGSGIAADDQQWTVFWREWVLWKPLHPIAVAGLAFGRGVVGHGCLSLLMRRRVAMELHCQIGSGDGRQCYADALARAKLATTLSFVVP